MSRREIEKKITEFWNKEQFFQRSVSERSVDDEYVFYDGPPFATGVPHHGHILGLTSKDVFPRYWTMRGKRVERKWGWDCHGLPVENIAEKELGIKQKNEIEVMGVTKFNEFCRSKVFYFANEWKKTVETMGKWIDFDNSYKTLDTTYMESIWWIFQKLYNEGFIYEGKKILMYCPRCQTPLANSEIQMDNSYKEVTEKTATVGFKIKGREDEYLLAWTTTPWTLIGNVALAINSKLSYAMIDVFGKKFILARDLVEKNFKHFELTKEIPGKELLGLEYEPLYEVPTDEKKGYYVIDGEEGVTSEDGTGIVHMAIYGEFDYQMIRKYNMPIIQHIGKDGSLVLGPKEWIGMWFKKVDREVIDDLYSRGLLVEAKEYTHSYPFCYRCETPLIYNAVDSWFVDIQKIKPKLIQKAQEINWYPENIKEGRFKYILETAPDWSISRNRFWATAIPVWKCECGKIKVIGSIKELKENAVEEISSEVDLHKHIVDGIHLKCDCGKEMTRIPEVLDCWFESGSMPFASKHYPFENKDWLAKNYPADFISEYIAQVRAWFYYMHVIGVLLMDKAPFKNVVVSGTILASDGSKMSKSKKNYTDPNVLFETYGADSMRFYLMSSQLMRAQDLNFLDDNVKEIHKKLMMILSNVKNFYELFASENNVFNDVLSENVLDKWMISRTNELIKNSTKNMDDYNTLGVCKDVLEYVDELSTWFVRRSRNRFKSEDLKEKREAIRTLAYALDSLSKIIAPITPFIAEEIYQALRKTKYEKNVSVHLEDWPKSNEELIDETLHKDMNKVREVISIALEERNKAGVAVRQPLKKVIVSGALIDKKFFDIILDELNVKEVELIEGEFSVILDTNLTKELLLEGAARDLMRKLNESRKEMGLTIKDSIVLNVSTESEMLKEMINTFSNDLKKSAQLREINFTPSLASSKEILIQKEKLLFELIK
jgi:isoleucyl-tRNA synthetase